MLEKKERKKIATLPLEMMKNEFNLKKHAHKSSLFLWRIWVIVDIADDILRKRGSPQGVTAFWKKKWS